MTETDSTEFEKSLEQIRRGKVPDSMAEIVRYCQKTTLEMHQFTAALAECVYRQDRQLKFLGEIVAKLEENLNRRTAK